MTNERFRLSTSQLKLIALITMIIDHVGLALFNDNAVMRNVGRIAFPLYVFVLVEGFFFTASRAKYLARLLVFAMISEVPFDLGLYGYSPRWVHQNVFITLTLGMAAIICMDFIFDNFDYDFAQILFQLSIMAVFMGAAHLIHSDYREYGVAAISIAWLLKRRGFDRIFEIIIIVAVLCMLSSNEVWSVISVPVVFLYDSSKAPSGGAFLKWFFYLVYPVHLVIIYLISLSGGV